MPLVASRDELGEGPAWFYDALWWVDIAGRRVNRWASGSESESWQLDRPASAVLPACDGSVIVTTSSGVERLHLATSTRGDLELLVPIEPDVEGNRSNDAACDPDGTLYVGTMHVDALPDRGTLYRVVDGRSEPVWYPVTISNGLGWSPDGRHMYYVDTGTGSVDVAPRAIDGGLGPRTTLVPADAAQGAPDGLAVAADGTIWVARWAGGCVAVHAPDGRMLGQVELPVRNVTSCCFGAPGSGSLFVTSAADPQDTTGLAGTVFRIPVEVDGVPTACWPAAGSTVTTREGQG